MSEAIAPETKARVACHSANRDCFADGPDAVAEFWARERVDVSIDPRNWGFPPVEETEIGF